MNTKLCGRTIAIIHKYAEIFKDNTDRRENITDLAQFYIDRFNDSVKIVEKQVETEVVLQTLDNIRSLQKMLSKELDSTLFVENCLRLLEDRIEKIKPDIFFRSLASFEEQKLKQRYVGSVLKALRENKFDVRRFNFPQLAQLIQLVAHY
jgi:hypothetical protein